MEGIDRNMVQKIIRDFEKNNNIEIDDIYVVPAVGKGENFMSIVSKIEAKGKKKENNKLTGKQK